MKVGITMIAKHQCRERENERERLVPSSQHKSSIAQIRSNIYSCIVKTSPSLTHTPAPSITSPKPFIFYYFFSLQSRPVINKTWKRRRIYGDGRGRSLTFTLLGMMARWRLYSSSLFLWCLPSVGDRRLLARYGGLSPAGAAAMSAVINTCPILGDSRD